jgi:hypothetical protein
MDSTRRPPQGVTDCQARLLVEELIGGEHAGAAAPAYAEATPIARDVPSPSKSSLLGLSAGLPTCL